MSTPSVPALESALAAFREGRNHAFIVHDNIADYAHPLTNARLAEYLASRFGRREVVVFYNPARGLSFAVPSMEAKFRAWAELAAPVLDDEEALLLAAVNSAKKPAPSQDERPLPTNPRGVLPLLEKVLRNGFTLTTTEEGEVMRGEVVVILEYMETVVPDAPMNMLSAEDRLNLVTLAQWGTDARIEQSGNAVFILAENLADLHQTLRATSHRWAAVEIPLPDFETRLTFITACLDAQGIALEPHVTPRMLAGATAGLTLISIEDVFLQAATAGTLRLNWVRTLKEEIIRREYAGLVEFVDPAFGFEQIGGLDYVKTFLQKNIIAPMKSGNCARVPMGVLFTGPAGTGKSAVAQAVAREAQINMLNLRIGGQIASMYQGEGERKLRRVLAAIVQFAPTIVFIDEIDQVVSRGNGNNQQESRIFQMLLEFMSQTTHRGRVVFLAATNRPDLMDAALRRPGRFDKKLPFLIPNASERTAIFQVMARKYGVASETIPAAALAATDGWTGAEIEAAVLKAYELIEDEALPAADALTEATRRLSPSTADIEFMTNLALQECNDLDLLPPGYRAAAQNKTALAEKIEQAPAFKRGKRAL